MGSFWKSISFPCWIFSSSTTNGIDPNATREFEHFAEMREEIRAVVFDPNAETDRSRHHTYWLDQPLPGEADPNPS